MWWLRQDVKGERWKKAHGCLCCLLVCLFPTFTCFGSCFIWVENECFVLLVMQGMRNRERRYPVKEGMNMRKQQGKVWDVTEHPRKHHDGVPPPAPSRAPKPVDEDLYKIPPELLRRTKRVRLRFHHHHFASFCCFVTLFTCYLSMLINFFEFVLICRRKCWVSFPSVWYLLLAFHEQWCVLESEDI